MLQPFELLNADYFPRLKELGKRYLVTQTYSRGLNHFADAEQVPILVSAYDNLGLAKTHQNAVKEDRFAAVIDLENLTHEQKITDMISGSKYQVYWAVVKNTADMEKRVNLKYKDHMRRYIEKNTNWRISRETTLRPTVQLIFGELYLNLKYSSQLIRVKFEDIERC